MKLHIKNNAKSYIRITRPLLPAITVLALSLAQSQADILGSADSFAVLGGTAVTSTGFTVLNGDLGVSPGTAITGFPPGIVNGNTYSAGSTASLAQTDAGLAFDALALEPATQSLTGIDMGGLVLYPGVYNYAASGGLTGTLTLDAQGDPNATFVFQMGSTLLAAAGSSVVLTGGAHSANVFWAVGSSATIGASDTFVGNILAAASITIGAGTTLDGRALADAAITLADNDITVPSPVPEPASVALFARCPVAFGVRRWLQTR